MARITIFIPDDVLDAAVQVAGPKLREANLRPSTSMMIQQALKLYAEREGRPEASQRGRIETLRTLRAARAALDDLERGLTQAKPVKRHVRRYSGRTRPAR